MPRPIMFCIKAPSDSFKLDYSKNSGAILVTPASALALALVLALALPSHKVKVLRASTYL